MKRKKLSAMLCAVLALAMPLNAMAATSEIVDEVVVEYAEEYDNSEMEETSEQGEADYISLENEEDFYVDNSEAVDESSECDDEVVVFEEEEAEDNQEAIEEEIAEEDTENVSDEESEAGEDVFCIDMRAETDLMYGDFDTVDIDMSEGVELTAGSNTSVVTANVTYGQTEARTILAMINELRTNSSTAWYWNSSNTEKVRVSNLKPLVYDYDLEAIAMQRAAECAIGYAHQRPNGRDCWSAQDDLGYTTIYVCGENIAAGYRSAASVFEGWAEEDEYYSGQGHRRNMLNSGFVSVGIGHVRFNGVDYWVQEFASNKSNTVATTANDSAKKVNVEVLNSQITIYEKTDDVLLEPGITYNLNNEGVTFRHVNTWPSSSKITINNLSPAYSLSGEGYAGLSSGKLTGKKNGTSTLTTTYFNGQSSVRKVVVRGHNYTTSTVEATCTEDGYTDKECTICGKIIHTEAAALGHDYNDTIYYPASAYSSGVIRHYCSRCGRYSYDTIPIGYTGLIQMNGKWCYFKSGARNTTYNGMVNQNGKWYYVTNGELVWGKEGMCEYNGTWYYIKNSTFTDSYTGMYQWGGTWYYITNGVLKWGQTGMTNYNGTWYYIENSTFKGNYTGLVYFSGSWYYVQNSVLKWGANTCVYYGGKWYYVKNSTVDFSYTGYTTYGGKSYRVVNGVVQA